MGAVDPHKAVSRAFWSVARAGLLLSGLLCSGCGTGTSSVNDFCAPIEGPTGGSPLGKWNVDPALACQVPTARVSSGDWCSKLVYDDRGVKDGLVLGQDFLPIIYDASDPTKQSVIEYKVDPMCGQNCGRYSAKLVFEGPSATDFPAGCLSQHEANPSCTDLGTKIQALVDANVLPGRPCGSPTHGLRRSAIRGNRHGANAKATAVRTLLRRIGRHAAGDPCSVWHAHQPGLGAGHAQAFLPFV